MSNVFRGKIDFLYNAAHLDLDHRNMSDLFKSTGEIVLGFKMLHGRKCQCFYSNKYNTAIYVCK